jgi:CheY-like chemotaxis protein
MKLRNRSRTPHRRSQEEAPKMTLDKIPVDVKPCLVLAHADIGFAARASRQFRLHGWDVYLARTGVEVRHLTKKVAPAVVVVDVDLADESGWLLCDKLNREQSVPKVILVGTNLTPEHERLASFVGAAALLWQQDGIAALVDEVLEATLPTAS